MSLRVVDRALAPDWLLENPFLLHGFRLFVPAPEEEIQSQQVLEAPEEKHPENEASALSQMASSAPPMKPHLPIRRQFLDRQNSTKTQPKTARNLDQKPTKAVQTFPGGWTVARSAFSWHNETINIWSHFAGFLYFVICLLWLLCSDPLALAERGSEDNARVGGSGAMDSSSSAEVLFFSLAPNPVVARALGFPVFAASPAMVRFVLGVTYICYAYGFGTSALFHTMGAHSEHMYWRTLRCDYSGISSIMLGSYLAPVFFGFFCWPAWQKFYLAVSCGTGTALVFCSVFARFHHNDLHWVRVGLWSTLAAFGAIPTLHHRWLMPTLESAAVAAAAASSSASPVPLMRAQHSDVQWRIGIMYCCLGLGLLVYIKKFPECRLPGRFDFCGASHQIWHICVLTGVLIHAGSITSIFSFWRMRQGECEMITL